MLQQTKKTETVSHQKITPADFYAIYDNLTYSLC